MNKRQAIQGAAEWLLAEIPALREHALYSPDLPLEKADRARMAAALDVLEERLGVTAYGRERMGPSRKVSPPDPNQVALFE